MDHPVGACCTVLCCDVFAGICLDFMTLRHQWTETLCRCCRSTEGELAVMDDPDERQPLNAKTSLQPSLHAPMRCTP
ncbi:hypothetical protein EDC04DRAFT_2725490 [Pisolithus marmoratus]|nr:hypothetical protein EDC04DRAFT_2725490 [Pisolithus marmoratus]